MLRRRLLRILLLAIPALGIAAVAAWLLGPQGGRFAAVRTADAIGGPIELVDQAGMRTTEARFAGRYALVYFGFTYCPDVCPTELAAMAAAIDALGAEGNRVDPVLVTVDPDRDTPSVLAEYVPLFHPRMVGLTGTAGQVSDAARQFKVYYQKVQPADGSPYLMDHTSYVYLLGPDWTTLDVFPARTAPDEMAERIRAQLAG